MADMLCLKADEGRGATGRMAGMGGGDGTMALPCLAAVSGIKADVQLLSAALASAAA